MIDRMIRKSRPFAIAVLTLGSLLITASAQAQELKTKNVVLIMLDGLRWQELFTGAEKEFDQQEAGRRVECQTD